MKSLVASEHVDVCSNDIWTDALMLLDLCWNGPLLLPPMVFHNVCRCA